MRNTINGVLTKLVHGALRHRFIAAQQISEKRSHHPKQHDGHKHPRKGWRSGV